MAGQEQSGLNLHRLSPELQAQLKPLYDRQSLDGAYLEIDMIHQGDVVLDCFMGSGTTAVATVRENRQFIGIELNADYAQLARERVAQLGLYGSPTDWRASLACTRTNN